MNSLDIQYIRDIATSLAELDEFDVRLKHSRGSIRLNRRGCAVPAVLEIKSPVQGTFWRVAEYGALAAVGSMVAPREILGFVELGQHRVALRAPRWATLTTECAADGASVFQGQPLLLLHLITRPVHLGDMP